MPYVGNPLADAYSARQKQDLTGQSGTSFTLTHSVSSPNDLSVYINHVRQEPTTAYTVNGTALTTTGSVAGTDDFYIIYDELAIQSISHPTNQALTATAGTFTSGLVGTTGTFSGALSGTTGTFSGKTLKLNAASKSWHSNFTIIDIGDQQAIGYYDGGGSHYMHNRYYDGAWKATETGAGGILIQSSGGDTIIYTSPSASADAAATVTEIARFSDAGLHLGGTGDANAINDYEEGTFTPRLYGSTTGNSTAASQIDANSTAKYWKIGGVVFCGIYFSGQQTSTQMTGQLNVSGLPFTANGTYMTSSSQARAMGLPNNDAAFQITGSVAGNTTVGFVNQVDNGSWVATDAADSVPNATSIYFRFTITYGTDA